MIYTEKRKRSPLSKEKIKFGGGGEGFRGTFIWGGHAPEPGHFERKTPQVCHQRVNRRVNSQGKIPEPKFERAESPPGWVARELTIQRKSWEDS